MTARMHVPGDVVANRYEILEFLNEGGMQQVYIAEDRRLTRRVALKIPKNESGAKRFDRSARLSARVRHPNVAATLDFFEDKGNQYLIEELVSGSDLKTRMETEFLYLDPHLAAHVLNHLARALSAAHHAGVCHRDIKPGNIIVSSDPSLSTIKITDFGIAKMADEELVQGVENWDKEENSITGSQTLVGAVPYMAPERFSASDRRQVLKESDVWGLGAILYQLLTGNPPFGRGAMAIANILGSVPVQPPPLFGKYAAFRQLEGDLWKIITTSLDRDPTKRPTADSLVDQCSKLCYATQLRFTGKIKSYKDGSGDWGFIAGDNFEVFLHRSEFYGTEIKVGTKVNFAPHLGNPYPRAAPVIPLRD